MDYTGLLVGFELEFVSSYSSVTVKDLLTNEFDLKFSGRKKVRWSIQYDSSVKSRCSKLNSHELISPPLPYNRALEMLQKLCNWMQVHGCKTNHTTGLHVNMSFAKPALNKKIDVVKLIVFTPKETLQDFKRQRNIYCKNYLRDFKNWSKTFKDENVNTWQDAVAALNRKLTTYGDKYRIVNVGKWYESKYVEFRGLGNLNYHMRYDDLTTHIEKMASALLISIDEQLHTSEYEKVISSYMINFA